MRVFYLCFSWFVDGSGSIFGRSRGVFGSGSGSISTLGCWGVDSGSFVGHLGNIALKIVGVVSDVLDPVIEV